MTKQQIACAAGVSVKTLSRWCQPHRQKLLDMGWQPTMKVLPPHIARYICDTFCIDTD